MPGLPRKDTKKRFSKLLKASGKSKTNTSAGAANINMSKISTKESRILNFQQFINESNRLIDNQ